MSLFLNLVHTLMLRSVRRLFSITFTISLLLVGSEANAQVFGRMRPVARGGQPTVSHRVPQTTQDASSSTERQHFQNDYPQNSLGVVKEKSVPPRSVSFGSSQRGFEDDSKIGSNVGSQARNIGIGAAIDSVAEGSGTDRGIVSGPTSSAPTRDATSTSTPPLLLQSSGKYEFITAVKAEDINSYVENVQGLCVVIPHKNFIISSQGTEEEGREQKLSSAVAEDVLQEHVTPSISDEDIDEQSLPGASPVDSSFYEDFIVFTLTNLAPQEAQLLRDSVDGRWNDFDLLNASLIAEGLTTSESRMHYRSRFESLVASLLQQTKNMQDQLQKTERVYNFLHSRALFSKYDLTCSSVAASLDTGVFNCVSATILFNCLASRAGLNVAALETTGHAKSRVKFEDSFLDIETTCSNWNKLPDRMRPYQVSRAHSNDMTPNETSTARVARDFSSSSHESSADGEGAAFNYVSLRSSSNDTTKEEGSTTFRIDSDAPLGYSFTRSRRPMREITDVELVATIYYNVGVDYSQVGDYERSIASYIKAVQLAPGNKTILGNLKATLNNWAIDVAMKEKDYEKAIHLTELGQRIDPDFREFKMNMPIFFHDWIDRLAKDNDWEGVKRVQNEYLARFPQ